MSFSMRTTVYAIKKKFPSVRNVSCQELVEWRKEGKLKCLVSMCKSYLECVDVATLHFLTGHQV